MSKPKTIGSIGRLQPRKGHKTLIEAMPYILHEFPDAQLRIAGADPDGYLAELKDLIHFLDLDGKVILEGFVEDIPKFLSELDVFALASTDEGLGLVLIEAMAAGLPVVCSDITPFREIINCFKCKPGDAKCFGTAIIAILKFPADFDQAHNFSAETMADKTLEVYRRVM